MKRLPRLILLGAVIVSCVSCDQVTKAVAGAELADGLPRSFLGDVLRLTYAENPGGFLSLGADLSPTLRSWIFGGFTGVIVLALGAFAIREPSLDRLRVTGLGLVIAGGLGNLIDRARLGAVRDFVVLGIGPLRTGVFNGADLAITCGAVALFAASAWRRRDKPSPGLHAR